MSEKLSDKYNAVVSGYVPAAAGWYLRELNNAGSPGDGMARMFRCGGTQRRCADPGVAIRHDW